VTVCLKGAAEAPIAAEAPKTPPPVSSEVEVTVTQTNAAGDTESDGGMYP